MSTWQKCPGCGKDVVVPDVWASTHPLRIDYDICGCASKQYVNTFQVIEKLDILNERQKAEAKARYDYYYQKEMERLNNE